MAKLALVWCNLIRDICLADIEEASKTLCIQLKLVLSANAAPTFWEKKADTTIQRIQTLEEWNGFKSGFYSSVSMQWDWTPYMLSFVKWYSFLLFYFQILWLLNPPYLSFRIIAVGSEQIKSGWLRSVSLLSLALLRLDGFPMIRTSLLKQKTCLIDRVKGCLPGEFCCFNGPQGIALWPGLIRF